MKHTLIAATFGLVALLAGCTGGTTDDAKPGPTSTTPTSSTASSLDSIKPCELMTDAETKELGVTNPGEPLKLGSGDTCDWTISGKGGVQVGVRPKAGVKDLALEGSSKSEIPVGKFTATKVEGQDGVADTCSIVISVTDSSSVSIISTLSGDSTEIAASCERATKAATFVAAKLP